MEEEVSDMGDYCGVQGYGYCAEDGVMESDRREESSSMRLATRKNGASGGPQRDRTVPGEMGKRRWRL